MGERDKLMHLIQMYCFQIYDLQLYLDTHPHCQRALDLLQKYVAMKREAEACYVERYGPITAEQAMPDTPWNWVDQPWPWERRDA